MLTYLYHKNVNHIILQKNLFNYQETKVIIKQGFNLK